MPLSGNIDGGRRNAERFDHVVRHRIQQLQNVVRRQQLLAEAVKPFEFATPAHGFVRLLSRPVRQFAGNHSRGEKGKEGNPVLRVGDGEGADGRKKVVVERRRGDERGEQCVTQTPQGGHDQHGNQKRQRNRRGVHVNDAWCRDAPRGTGLLRTTAKRSDHSDRRLFHDQRL